MSSVSLFRRRLYDGIRTEATRDTTFRPERGEMNHDTSLRLLCLLLGLWLDSSSEVEKMSLLVCLHDELCGMLEVFFAVFRLR